MTKIVVGEDCGNAPKKLLLRDFNIVFAKHEKAHLLRNITDTIRWNLVGDKVVEGKEQFEKELERMKERKTTELVINNIITHGNSGAMDGTFTLDNGRSYAFCDVYRFSSAAKSAKIKEITSYVIES
jgi:hypothetical protein